MDNTNTGFRTYIGRNVLYPVERLVVSKITYYYHTHIVLIILTVGQ